MTPGPKKPTEKLADLVPLAARPNYAGLPVLESCEGCGACCQHMRSPPFLVFFDRAEPRLMCRPGEIADDYAIMDLEWLMAAPDEARAAYRERLYSKLPDGVPCVWLDRATNQCKYHAFRPGVCRDFERSSNDCRDARVRVFGSP